MSYRLVNQKRPSRTLTVTKGTWFGLLDTALENGWNPLGVVRPDWGLLPGGDLFGEMDELASDGYTAKKHGLVLFEDALNLADALERAIEAYEPEWTRFQEWGGVTLSGVTLALEKVTPSLGAMGCLVDFCRMGAFHIDC